MEKLFDVNLLPLTNYKLKGEKDKLETTENNCYAIPKSYYDHFVTNGYEYIIINPHSVLAGAEAVLKQHNFITKFDHINCFEQTFLAYRETKLENTFKKNWNITMCVMLCERNLPEEVQRFVSYYDTQGIDMIYMFWCGDISTMPNYPIHNKITYLEWNFNPFWITIQDKKIHYLQIPLYNTFIKKISLCCNWTIFCDLDEYIQSVTHNTIKEHLEEKQTHVFCAHRIAKINFEEKKVIYEAVTSSVNRGKSILKSSLITPHCKAKVHQSLGATLDEQLLMFHDRRNCYKHLETNAVKCNIL